MNRNAGKNRRRIRGTSNHSAIEVAEPRVLLSATVPDLSAVSSQSDAVTPRTKETEIEASFLSTTGGYGFRIDEIRLHGGEIHVFSTITSPAPGQIVTQAFVNHRDAATVIVPDRDFQIVQHQADANSPQPDLYLLRKSADSTLLFRDPAADLLTAWPITDVDPAEGSTVGLDFTAAPATPKGVLAVQDTEGSESVTIYFDERSPVLVDKANRHFRGYRYSVFDTNGRAQASGEVTVSDETFYTVSGSDGATRTFGAKTQLNLPNGTHIFAPSVRILPVFPDGATNVNALASPWSEEIASAHFNVLPKGHDLLIGEVVRDYYSETPATVVSWAPVKNAVTYEVSIADSSGREVIRKTGLTATEFRTSQPVDPGEYDVWIRAIRRDGSRSKWSRSFHLTAGNPLYDLSITESIAPAPENNLNAWPWRDTTPTIGWRSVPWSIGYQIRIIDRARELTAAAADFPSIEAYERFVTAYYFRESGNAHEHTVTTALTGNSRIEVTLYFANGAKTSADLSLNFDPTPPAPSGHNGKLAWNNVTQTTGFDVWIAYLNPYPSGRTLDSQVGVWKFILAENITTGGFELPASAPGGRYRAWIRPHFNFDGVLARGLWSYSTDWTVSPPALRAPVVKVDGETISWSAVPGATNYEVSIRRASSDSDILPDTPDRIVSVSSGTTFQLPPEIDAGKYAVHVRAFGADVPSGGSYSSWVTVNHGQSAWNWNVVNTATSLQWDPVPNAIRYHVLIEQGGKTTVDTEIESATSLSLPANLIADVHGVKIRALRSVDRQEFWTEWKLATFFPGVYRPDGIQVSGTTVSWNPQLDATYYFVRIDIAGGTFEVSADTLAAASYYRTTTGIELTTESSSIDLAEVIGSVSGTQGVRFLVSVRSFATGLGDAPHDLSFAFGLPSVPVEITPELFLSIPLPIIERIARPAPSAPELNDSTGDTVTTHGGGWGTLYPGEGIQPAARLYQDKNGFAFQQGAVARYEIRTENTRTGKVQILDESQLSFLSQLLTTKTANQHLSIPPAGSAVSLGNSLGLNVGVYKVQVRVQYLPVMLPVTGTAKMPLLLKEPGVAPDRINIAATPWSAWSSTVEKIVLPMGQNVLPLPNSLATIESRPVFEWRSNEANANYELWVENRATRQRVIWKTHFEQNSFQSTTDLPPGQYDWWVRIEETTGPRNGWSPKQSLEIYAPAISTNVAAETVDATPVMSWTANAAAQSFTVIVTSVTTGKVVYQGTAVRNQTWHRVPTALPNDTYTVSIQALFANGARSAPGVAKADGTFAMPKMLVGAAPKVTARSSSVVTWTAVNGATRYEIWINHVDLTGKVVHLATEQTVETTHQLPAALAGRSGQYRIWVRAIRNESGLTFTGRWSSLATIGTSATAAINLRSSTDLLTVMSELATSGPPMS